MSLVFNIESASRGLVRDPTPEFSTQWVWDQVQKGASQAHSQVKLVVPATLGEAPCYVKDRLWVAEVCLCRSKRAGFLRLTWGWGPE